MSVQLASSASASRLRPSAIPFSPLNYDFRVRTSTPAAQTPRRRHRRKVSNRHDFAVVRTHGRAARIPKAICVRGRAATRPRIRLRSSPSRRPSSCRARDATGTGSNSNTSGRSSRAVIPTREGCPRDDRRHLERKFEGRPMRAHVRATACRLAKGQQRPGSPSLVIRWSAGRRPEARRRRAQPFRPGGARRPRRPCRRGAPSGCRPRP